jgi:hypothetical protein
MPLSFLKEASLFTALIIGILELVTYMSQTTKEYYFYQFIIQILIYAITVTLQRLDFRITQELLHNNTPETTLMLHAIFIFTIFIEEEKYFN